MVSALRADLAQIFDVPPSTVRISVEAPAGARRGRRASDRCTTEAAQQVFILVTIPGVPVEDATVNSLDGVRDAVRASCTDEQGCNACTSISVSFGFRPGPNGDDAVPSVVLVAIGLVAVLSLFFNLWWFCGHNSSRNFWRGGVAPSDVLSKHMRKMSQPSSSISPGGIVSVDGFRREPRCTWTPTRRYACFLSHFKTESGSDARYLAGSVQRDSNTCRGARSPFPRARCRFRMRRRSHLISPLAPQTCWGECSLLPSIWIAAT